MKTYDTAQITRAIPKKHRDKVECIEFYPGGIAIWLHVGWTYEAADGNRAVEHYNYDDDYGQTILQQIKDDFRWIEEATNK
jgi:hypothetical protein